MTCPDAAVTEYIREILNMDKFIESNGQKASFEANPRTFDVSSAHFQ